MKIEKTYTNPFKKNKTGGVTLFDFKTYHKVVVIRPV